MAFRVGQKVVLIKDVWKDHLWMLIPNRPILGVTYTVRSCGISSSSGPRLLLEEISNPDGPWRCSIKEGSFPEQRFRPLIEKSTDTGMAILREILDRESYVIKTPAKA